jgi:predicted SprT family Zn-dependent metalloprotease
MHIKFLIKGYLFGVKPYHIGYATIKLPELLYGEKLHEARQGTIVHELCHLVHSYDTSENIINKEVVKRGYLYQLVASTIILSNHERFKSHSTKTFLKRDLY